MDLVKGAWFDFYVFHTHQAKDIHNDYESLLYYKMSLCTQKQGGMHVYNQIENRCFCGSSATSVVYSEVAV